jgi:biopolymer transport protein TolR
MAGSSMQSEDGEITEINVTPLVDVVLVLLVVFMATATYIVNQSINVNLPKVATADDPGGKNLAFVLDKDSNLYLDGQAMSFDTVGRVIEEQKSKATGSVQALITADQATPHGSVVKLIDLVRRNGITDFAINVEVESPSPE